MTDELFASIRKTQLPKTPETLSIDCFIEDQTRRQNKAMDEAFNIGYKNGLRAGRIGERKRIEAGFITKRRESFFDYFWTITGTATVAGGIGVFVGIQLHNWILP